MVSFAPVLVRVSQRSFAQVHAFPLHPAAIAQPRPGEIGKQDKQLPFAVRHIHHHFYFRRGERAAFHAFAFRQFHGFGGIVRNQTLPPGRVQRRANNFPSKPTVTGASPKPMR